MYKDLVEKISQKYNLNVLRDSEIYLFGTAVLGRKIYSQLKSFGIQVKGFLDNDKSKHGKFIQDVEIFDINCIKNKENTVIIICSTNYFYEIGIQAEKAGFKIIIPSFALPLIDSNHFPWELAFDNIIKSYIDNEELFLKTSKLFTDNLSKKTFDTICQFRRTLDYKLYHDIAQPISKQYFEGFIPYNGEQFIDAGAFDGDTVSRFLNFSSENYENIICFEPDENSYQKLIKSYSKYKNISFYKKGLSDICDTVSFDSRGDFGSVISKDGNAQIDIIALDKFLNPKKSFIKMDIEGEEQRALVGATEFIKMGSILAICVYHKPLDIIEIPKLILEINPNYKFYLRHYTNCIFETVLYAIPEK